MQEPTPTTTQVSKIVIEIVRGCVRPVITILFAGVLAAVAIHGVVTGNMVDLPDWLRLLLASPIVFWFGTRPLEKQLNGGS